MGLKKTQADNILSLWRIGLSLRQISLHLNIPKSTIYDKVKGLPNGPKINLGGRPRLLQERHKNYIRRLITSGSCDTAAEAARVLSTDLETS